MAYFEIVRASGGYRAHFHAGGRLVWWTEVYETKAGAANAIASIKRNTPMPRSMTGRRSPSGRRGGGVAWSLRLLIS